MILEELREQFNQLATSNPGFADKKHVVGDAASEAAKQAVETRKTRHPHLMPVWDMGAQGIRSVNLETVSRIAVDGVVREYTR